MADPSQNAPAAPIQAVGKKRLPSRRTVRPLLFGFLVLSFALIFAVVYGSVPIRPFATWNVNEESNGWSFSPDSKLFLSKSDRFGCFQCWDLEQGTERFSVAPERPLLNVNRGIKIGEEAGIFTPDSRLFAANDSEGRLKIWNTSTGEEVASCTPETKIGSWCKHCFSPDGAFLAVQNPREESEKSDSVTFWSVESKKRYGTVKANLKALDFAPDGKSFATHEKNDKVVHVYLWSVDRSNGLTLVKEHTLEGDHVAFSPDLKTIALAVTPASGLARVEIRDMATGARQLSFTYQVDERRLRELTFEGNGKYLVARSSGLPAEKGDRKWQLWDVSSAQKEVGTYVGRYPLISPTGDTLAICHGEWIDLANLPTMQQYGTLRTEFNDWPPSAEFSGNGKQLIQAFAYARPAHYLSKWLPDSMNPFARNRGGVVIRMWDVASASEQISVDEAISGTISPDSKWLATVNRDCKTVQIWSIPIRKPILEIFVWSLASWLVFVVGLAVVLKVRKRRRSLATAPLPPSVIARADSQAQS